MSENEPEYKKHEGASVKNELLSKIFDVSSDVLRGTNDHNILSNVIVQNMKACIEAYNSPQFSSESATVEYLTERLRQLSELSDDFKKPKGSWKYCRVTKNPDSFEIAYLGETIIIPLFK